jgi:hypothetical protein
MDTMDMYEYVNMCMDIYIYMYVFIHVWICSYMPVCVLSKEV